MNTVRFAWLSLLRDWKSGEVRLMAAALILSVGAMTTIGFYTDRVRLAMQQQAGTLLAADLALASADPLDPRYVRKARELGLKTSQTIAFRSMVAVGDELAMVEVKAIARPYPLRGRLAIGSTIGAIPRQTEQVPATGSVWLDPQLLQTLGRRVGERIELGTMQFTIAQLLLFEPDRGGEMFHIAPRLMMNQADLPNTGLLAPGSRVRYRLLVAGPKPAVDTYRSWAKTRLDGDTRVLSLQDAQPQLRTTVERAEQFLGLVALSSVILAGVAIAASAQRFTSRHLDHCAMMRCIGATQAHIVKVYALMLLMLGVVTGLLGALLGLAAQSVLATLITDLTAGELPAPTAWPLVPGVLTGLIALFGFALPRVMQLKNVPPSRVLRRQAMAKNTSEVLVYGAAVLAIVALLTWQTGDPMMTLYVLGGSLTTVAVLALVSWLLIRCLHPLRRQVGMAWRFGLTNLARRARTSIVQTVALGLGILVILILTVVRNDLLEGWKASLGPDTPNHFAINIDPHQSADVAEFFIANGLPAPQQFPITHGRLVAINQVPVEPARFTTIRGRRLAMREFHLTWSAMLPSKNQVIAGDWWADQDPQPGQFSIEADIAETLGVHIGDVLTFRRAGQDISARVTNVRRLEWDSFTPNFFVIASPGVLDNTWRPISPVSFCRPAKRPCWRSSIGVSRR